MKMRKTNAKSIHTKLGFYLILIAGMIELYLGLRYMFSDIPSDQRFGIISILESMFAFSGLFIPDLLIYKRLRLIPSNDEFKPLDSNVFARMIIIFITLVLIQVIFMFVPMTVRTYEKALAVAFAGPSEEALFRGVLISIFISMGSNSEKITITSKIEISVIEIIGIIISSMLFMLLHVNYSSNPSLLVAVFFSGVALAVFYWKWRDLTACILAHLVLNIINVIQTFYVVIL